MSEQISAFYSARPTIKVEGQEKPELVQGLLALLVEETTDGLYRCELTIANWGSTGSSVGYPFFDGQVLDFGKKLAIAIGDGDAAATIFQGRIMGLEGRYPQARPPEIGVLVEDRLQELRMTRRTRTFEDVSDEDVLRQIASDHGLQAQIDLTGSVSHKVLAQVNQTDLAFARERARAVDAEVWVEGDTLHAQARSKRHAADVSLKFGQRLREFAVLADLAGQRTAVEVAGWDVGAKDAIKVEATDATVQGELDGKRSGAKVLQEKFAERKERLVHTVPVHDQEAQALADATYRRMARRFLTGAGVAEGDGRLRVGAYVKLEGLGDWFDGSYYVTEARHLFDNVNGYRTHFRVERPGIGG